MRIVNVSALAEIESANTVVNRIATVRTTAGILLISILVKVTPFL